MRGITRDAGKDRAGGPIIKGSPNVFANNKPVVRKGDLIARHGKGSHSAPVMLTGSSDVYTNNIRTCRKNDLASCGHHSTGSPNTFVN